MELNQSSLARLASWSAIISIPTVWLHLPSSRDLPSRQVIAPSKKKGGLVIPPWLTYHHTDWKVTACWLSHHLTRAEQSPAAIRLSPPGMISQSIMITAALGYEWASNHHLGINASTWDLNNFAAWPGNQLEWYFNQKNGRSNNWEWFGNQNRRGLKSGGNEWGNHLFD